MKQRDIQVRQQPLTTSVDPDIFKALDILKKLSQSSNDRPRIIEKIAELRKKGVSLKVLAECCGVTTRTIGNWRAMAARSDKKSVRHNSRASLQNNQSPQIGVLDVVHPVRRDSKPRSTERQLPEMRVFDVVRPKNGEEAVGPKINFGAEWGQFRFKIEIW